MSGSKLSKARLKTLLMLGCLMVNSTQVAAIPEFLVQVTAVYFGNLVNRTGSCVINPTTGALTSGQSMCVNGHRLGLIRVVGDVNKGIKVTVNQGTNLPQGITFNPEVRLTNNLGADITNSIAGTETWINIGTDGLVDISIGGSMTLSQVLGASSAYFTLFDIEVEPQ